jgi:hypothetical protein
MHNWGIELHTLVLVEQGSAGSHQGGDDSCCELHCLIPNAGKGKMSDRWMGVWIKLSSAILQIAGLLYQAGSGLRSAPSDNTRSSLILALASKTAASSE